MNTHRLKTLSHLLRNIRTEVPEVRVFDMDVFYRDSPLRYAAADDDAQALYPEGFCGTSACALGTAALYPPFQAKGLNIDKGCVSVTYKGHYNFKAAAEFFEISYGKAKAIFYPSNRLYGTYKITPDMVADVIDNLVKTGELPNTPAS